MPTLTISKPVTISKPLTAGAGGGLLTGLLAIFLPLLQAFPQHVPASTESAAVYSGMAMVVTSVGGWLVAHGVIHVAQLKHDAAIAVADVPDLSRLAAQIEQTALQGDHVLKIVAPGLDGRIDELAQNYKRDIAGLAEQVASHVGLTVPEAEALAKKVYLEIANAFPAPTASAATPTSVTTTAPQAPAAPPAVA